MPKILKSISNVFFVNSSTSLNKDRRKQYYKVLWIIIGLHLLGLITILLVAFRFTDSQAYIFIVSSLLEIVSFISGLFLFVLSLKGEALVSQTYEFAVATAHASTHSFSTFKRHLEWLKEYLSPEKYAGLAPNLCISVSTPVYGIGDSLASADEFISYLESWVEFYEQTTKPSGNRPTIEFTVWNKDENYKTFTRNYTDWDTKEKLKRIDIFANLLTRLKKLRDKGCINFYLFFSDRSDARIFMAYSCPERKYRGIVVLFSPLSDSAVLNKKWTLTGFSFCEEKGYENVYDFNYRLTHQQHGKHREDNVDLLDNSKEWLLNHYGLNATELIDKI